MANSPHRVVHNTERVFMDLHCHVGETTMWLDTVKIYLGEKCKPCLQPLSIITVLSDLEDVQTFQHLEILRCSLKLGQHSFR